LQTAGIDHIVTSRVHRFQTAAELVFSICTEEDCATSGCFALIMWTVWKNRNDKVWNDTKEPGRSIGIKALQQWQYGTTMVFGSATLSVIIAAATTSHCMAKTTYGLVQM
jgi:hypothetical protein